MSLKSVILFLLFWFANATEDDDIKSITGNYLENEPASTTKAKSILKELKERENLFSHNLLPRAKGEAEPVFTKERLLFHSLSSSYKGEAVPWLEREFPLQLSYQGILYSLKSCSVEQEAERDPSWRFTMTYDVLRLVYQSDFHKINVTMKDPVGRKISFWLNEPDGLVDWNRGSVKNDLSKERKTAATHNNVQLDDRVLNEMLESSPKFDLTFLKEIWENIDMTEGNREVTRLSRSVEAAKSKASCLKKYYFLAFFPLVIGSLFTGCEGFYGVCEFGLRQLIGLIYFIVASFLLYMKLD